jgi:hypothetical protein
VARSNQYGKPVFATLLLPGSGFEVVDTSARVSLANHTDHEYASIGRFMRLILDEYFQDFIRETPRKSPNQPACHPEGADHSAK